MMLNNFYISNFRTFEELTVERFGRVNLVVGRNSVGKTTLLEAIGLYCARMDLDAVHEVLLRRDEVATDRDSDSRDIEVDVAALFNGRVHDTDANTPGMILGPKDDPASQIRLRMAWVEQNLSSEPAPVTYTEIAANEMTDAEGPVLPAIILNVGNVQRQIVSGYRNWFRHSRMVRRSRFSRMPPFIHAREVDEELVAGWWDAIALRDSEFRIVDSLNLLAPIDRISLVDSPQKNQNRIFMTRLKSSRGPQPLKSLGDGVERVFRTVLAVEFARRSLADSQLELFPDLPVSGEFGSSVLLVDEIDTGIHYSAIADYWSILFDLAEELDVQIFATTHSWDCVEGFQAAVNDRENRSGVLVRIEQNEGGVHKSIVIDKAALAIVTRDDIEVR